MKDLITTRLFFAVIISVCVLVLPYTAMFVITNSADMYIPLYNLLIFISTFGFTFSIVIFAVLTFVGRNYRLPVVNFLFFLTLTATVQYYLLSESIANLNGQNFRPYTTVEISVDLMIYAVVGGIIYVFRTRIYEHIKLFGTGICLFHIINLGVLIHSHDGILDDAPIPKLDVSAAGRFSSTANVLHIVLDGFQAQLFGDIIKNDDNIASKMDGFLYFPDTLASSEVTQLSFATFLTGREYTNTEPMKTYLFNSGLARMGTSKPDRNVPNILKAAARGGFRVEVVTPFKLIKDQDFYSEFIFIHKPYQSATEIREVVDYQRYFVFDLTIFRSVPKFLKKYIYNEGRWILSGYFTQNYGAEYNHHAGVLFLRDMMSKFAVLKLPRTYKLIHLITPHAPFVTNSNCEFSGKELKRQYENIYNQARCALIELIELFNTLKKAGIYDSATILIHADHGIRLPLTDFEDHSDGHGSNYPQPIGNSNPVLLIKPPGKRGGLEVIWSEVSLTDIPKTISALLHLDRNFPGVDFLNQKRTNRLRRYFHSKQSRVAAGRDDRFLQWDEYEVSGPINKMSSWKKTGETTWKQKDFGKFPIVEFLEIEQIHLTDEKEIRIRYRDRKRHHFIAVGSEKRVTRFVGVDLITAKLRSRSDIDRVCIIDVVNEMRQCPR